MISVVFQSNDYWVIHKPAGMSFHAESETLGVMQSLAEAYPEQTFYPVHRLDKMTSGLLIVACHAKATATFGAMFEQHLVEKRYIALSGKKPKKKQGTIRGGMVPSRRGQWKLTKTQENLAITEFFSSSFQGLRAFFLRPLTGKTHQIRVALKSIGAPILGDTRYGGGAADRGYLHAYCLRFEWQGKKCEYICPPTGSLYFSTAFAEFVKVHFDDTQLKWPSDK
ncbi:TIGR01621 family pseudouridine synthase [Marinomonas algarum]|uniref:TIGR01621 family pseudouridine synthase n=1 Tax=Marinomonas algarum TaxID=2883105 RepID=A0A9X1LE56_9GAMM|nr:TIGR01621 family pseudouridine synthase [Marinomonas algarum]MCB5160585.1 TIGR01621 family pseudouridine synthase [Marinomonas algarum]